MKHNFYDVFLCHIHFVTLLRNKIFFVRAHLIENQSEAVMVLYDRNWQYWRKYFHFRKSSFFSFLFLWQEMFRNFCVSHSATFARNRGTQIILLPIIVYTIQKFHRKNFWKFIFYPIKKHLNAVKV